VLFRSGPVFEPIINPTIEEMKKIKPDYIVPMHCTGWNAINAFSREMPEQFILNGVGTQYIF
jgi:7,8-dihydropterin-6-yl-methyl-4-(beta-D-ribofuranosyl)aminobenzene 5'-phosphate synthase